MSFIKNEWIRQRFLCAPFKLRAAVLLLGVSIPLTAWSLTLSDYLNQSTVVASSSQFEVNTADNVDTVQIIPNAEIIIVKDVVNDNGGEGVLADFSVTTSAGALTFDSGVVTGDTTTYTSETLFVPPGVYTLGEVDVDGYTEGTWSCSAGTMGSDSFDTGSVTLAFGEQTVCTIVNNDIAPTVTLTKTVTNDDGGLLTDADFSLTVGGVVVSSGVPTPVVANTQIIIAEADVDGYAEGTWACIDANGLTTSLPATGTATGTTIELESGSDVNCSITNNDIAPTIALTKTLVNDNGGLKTIEDFDLTITQSSVAKIVDSGTPNTVLANTALTISELDFPGYTEGTWSCVDSTSLTTTLPSLGVATGESLTLSPGSVVNCSISNDDIAPTLTLVKTLINDNGGTGQIEDFDISIGTTVVVSGQPTTVNANEVIRISELDLVPYSEGTWACTDANGLTTGLPTTGLATGTDITLQLGSEVTCEITNNDLGIDLSIAKTVDDSTPNIGQTITFTLEVSNAGPDLATDVTVVDPVPAGFTYVAGSITGGDVSVDVDPAGAGLSWTINSVPVGAPVSLTFEAVVNAP